MSTRPFRRVTVLRRSTDGMSNRQRHGDRQVGGDVAHVARPLGRWSAEDRMPTVAGRRGGGTDGGGSASLGSSGTRAAEQPGIMRGGDADRWR